MSLDETAEKCSKTKETLKRWMTAYRENGLEGLQRKLRSDRGKPRD